MNGKERKTSLIKKIEKKEFNSEMKNLGYL